ncbi:MAG: hypothetical protein IJ217_03425 [Clostridia bacterium]|nr:hypothetical protein [Clostridia bacterium]
MCVHEKSYEQGKGRDSYSLENECRAALKKQEREANMDNSERKAAIICAAVVLVFFIVFFGIRAFGGYYSFTSKEMVNYNAFAKGLANAGVTTNLADRISFSDISLSKADALGRYHLSIKTTKGVISYAIEKGGAISAPTVSRVSLIAVNTLIALIFTVFAACIGYLGASTIQLRNEIKKTKEKMT